MLFRSPSHLPWVGLKGWVLRIELRLLPSQDTFPGMDQPMAPVAHLPWQHQEPVPMLRAHLDTAAHLTFIITAPRIQEITSLWDPLPLLGKIPGISEESSRRFFVHSVLFDMGCGMRDLVQATRSSCLRCVWYTGLTSSGLRYPSSSAGRPTRHISSRSMSPRCAQPAPMKKSWQTGLHWHVRMRLCPGYEIFPRSRLSHGPICAMSSWGLSKELTSTRERSMTCTT